MIGSIIRSIILLAIGLPLLWLARKAVNRGISRSFSQQAAHFLDTILFYGGVTLLTISILNDFGFHLSAFLGTAGIMGIAVAFAAQTSISNVISGGFLVFENAFKVGDTISAAGVTGKIESIDLFAVKLRTIDNQLVRISHEFLLKNNVINANHFQTRRLSFSISTPLESKPQEVTALIMGYVQESKNILKNPAPMLTYTDFDDRANKRELKIWVESDNAIATAIQLKDAIREQAEKQGVLLAIEDK